MSTGFETATRNTESTTTSAENTTLKTWLDQLSLHEGAAADAAGGTALRATVAACKANDPFYNPPTPKILDDDHFSQNDDTPKTTTTRAVVLNSSEPDHCAICFDELFFESKATLDCGHEFCLVCILQWTKSCQYRNQQKRCPMCKVQFEHITCAFRYDGEFTNNGGERVLADLMAKARWLQVPEPGDGMKEIFNADDAVAFEAAEEEDLQLSSHHHIRSHSLDEHEHVHEDVWGEYDYCDWADEEDLFRRVGRGHWSRKRESENGSTTHIVNAQRRSPNGGGGSSSSSGSRTSTSTSTPTSTGKKMGRRARRNAKRREADAKAAEEMLGCGSRTSM
eukprot:Clim_evm46s235 gene=Clim_evmTU46s235